MIIRIKHDFPFINIREGMRELLKTEGNEWHNHVWSLLLHKFNENTAKLKKKKKYSCTLFFIIALSLTCTVYLLARVVFNMLDSDRGQVLMLCVAVRNRCK